MDLRARTTVEASGDEVWAVVRDLASYPRWLGIVERAEPHGEAAWIVDLVGRLGPLRRTKRVRMERVVDDGRRVVFERRELDGASHSTWRLTADVEPLDGRASVAVHLHYSGAPTLPLVDRLLRDEARRAGPKLEALIRQR